MLIIWDVFCISLNRLFPFQYEVNFKIIPSIKDETFEISRISFPYNYVLLHIIFTFI